MTIFELIGRQSHWDQLRTFGSNRLVQASIAIPVLGYVLLFNQELAVYLKLYFEEDIGTIPERLYWLYYGFWLLTLGSITYGIFCPEEVKHHGAAYDFIDKQRGIVGDHRANHMLDRLVRRYYSKTRGKSKLTFSQASAIYDPSDVPEDKVDAKLISLMTHEQLRLSKLNLGDLMLEYFEMLEEIRSWARWPTLIFYYGGFAVIAVPTVQTAYRITLRALA